MVPRPICSTRTNSALLTVGVVGGGWASVDGRRLAIRRKVASPGLDPDELTEIQTHEGAQNCLETIGRAVASGRLGDRHAQAVSRAV